MKRFLTKLTRLVLVLIMAVALMSGCGSVTTSSRSSSSGSSGSSETTVSDTIAQDGEYTTKEDVSLYLHTYGELPSNFITKKEAQKLGWSGGGLDDYQYGACIGGDRFGNYEKVLPTGASYHECDIDTMHKKSRGAKRLVYDEDGNIYYTEDHYETFDQLY